ncbi:MAG TPA: PQQ-dependent dehydrogenase, methanol/ethanol family [Burkholderiales bacterium]|nr:PQQ-dependent dehydrogenase, methanol/ethanol family [Burkholderiales bacterium]
MKTIYAALLCAWCTAASAQTADELLNDAQNTDDVLTFGMGYGIPMWSPLKQIDKSSVKRLVPIWSTNLMSEMGELSHPTVYKGVMYVVNGNWTFALDVATGRQLWRTPVQYDRAVMRIANAGAIMRGPATIYNGKLYRTTLDAHVLALDMKTGKQVWKQKFADFKEGYKGVAAPLVANGVLITGTTGGENATRGFLVGWDPETGKELWRTYTIPAPGEPGHETWPKTADATPDAWMTGGGSTWQNGSYDPQLDLVYWGVGNAAPYDPKYRGNGDALYTNSVLAIKPATGKIVWHYQFTPNDMYDADGSNENVIADLPVNGEMRKVIINANKNGFLYVIDRTNGKLIAANPLTRVNWASKIDLDTGRPVLTDVAQRLMKGEEVEIYPQRGTNATLFAYNPKTRLVYFNNWDLARIQKFIPYKFEKLGEPSTAVEGKNPDVKPDTVVGYHVAMDPLTGKAKWKVPITGIPNAASVLATDGGLLFTGRPTGEFIALDEATGETLWQFKTGSSINAPAITYTYKGQQYVTVQSGLGGSVIKRFIGDTVPTGGAVWTFALMPQ